MCIFRRECSACVRRVEVSRVHAESSSSLRKSEKVKTRKRATMCLRFNPYHFFVNS